jgi:hypothetical protein
VGSGVFVGAGDGDCVPVGVGVGVRVWVGDAVGDPVGVPVGVWAVYMTRSAKTPSSKLLQPSTQR